MKALSLWQPWAQLMAVGAKRIETRHWPTRYRGLLALHAAKRKADQEFMEGCPAAVDALAGEVLAYGAIVAVVEVYDVKPTEWIARNQALGVEEEFGNFGVERFGWLTRNCVKLKEPVVTRGFQSIWELPADVELKVREQMLPPPPHVGGYGKGGV